MLKRRLHRRTAAVVAAGLAGVLLAACAGGGSSANGSSSDSSSGGSPTAQALDWAKKNIPGLPASTVQAACKQGQVLVYSLLFDDKMQSVIDAFNKAFPCIKVSNQEASGAAIAQRFQTEAQAGQTTADVLINSSPGLADQFVKDGLLAKWDAPNQNRVDPAFQHSGYWWSLGIVPIGIAWNADAVSAADNDKLAKIKTWKQLLDLNKSPGPTGMINVRAGGAVELPYYYLDQTYGDSALQTLKNNLKPTTFDGIFPLTAQLTSGQLSFAALLGGDSAVAAAYKKGADVRWRNLSPGLAGLFYDSLSAKAKNPDAAKAFIAWSMSAAGQQVWNSGEGLYPVNSSIKDKRSWAKESWYYTPPLSTFSKTDYNAMTAATTKLTATWDGIFG